MSNPNLIANPLQHKAAIQVSRQQKRIINIAGIIVLISVFVALFSKSPKIVLINALIGIVILLLEISKLRGPKLLFERWTLFNPAQLQEYSLGNKHQEMDLFKTFVKSYEDCQERLQTALATTAGADARREVHSIKGAAATLGFTELATCYKSLEQLASQNELKALGRKLPEAQAVYNRSLRAFNDYYTHGEKE